MVRHKLKLGILLPTRGLLLADDPPLDAKLIIDMARLAEDSGLDSVWVGDSLTAKPRLEPLLTLAAVAACTKKLRLGTAVLLAPLRHPVLLAQMVGTLDMISGGRTILGVGAGGTFSKDQRHEFEVSGTTIPRRGQRLEEVIEIVKGLGATTSFSFTGKHFNLVGVSVEPRPIQPSGIPVLFACHLRAQQEAQFRRAARLGNGYISISEPPEDFAEVGRRVRHYAKEYGKDHEFIEGTFYLTINLNKAEKAAQSEADNYIKRYYGINIWRNLWGPWGPPQLAIHRIQQYASAGANTIIVRFASFNPMGQLKTFLREVAPRFI